MFFIRKHFTTIITIIIALVIGYWTFGGDSLNRSNNINYTTFVSDVDKNKVRDVTFYNSGLIDVITTTGKYQTVMPVYDNKILEQLLSKKVIVNGTLPEKPGIISSIISSLLPIVIMIVIWVFLMRSMSGGGGARIMGNSKKIQMIPPDQVKTRLADVAGLDEAKVEVAEIVDYLKDPSKFQSIGGRIPSGVLMVGPPGTGKTLLARAIAGEAGVPFFPTSGSNFVEMFVGVGASRVRQLFEEAKKNAPCIIFIDEIDAVGRKRGNGQSGGNDEREQTLNQILVEMDGFEGNEGIIIISATNRVDILDNALTRPGRFDRQVYMGLPDIKGREQILKVHAKKVILDPEVDLRIVARSTPGFSGADLANLVNESALMAAREGGSSVTMKYFEMAQDKIIMGNERKTFVMSPEDKERTSYHEAGHAIVGYLTPGHDPVHKVTIVPRGRALGVTYFLPDTDKVSLSLEQLESQLSTLYAGRIAEELMYGPYKVTTGASNDIERATQLAYRMVTEWGYSSELGPIKYSPDDNDYYSQTRTSSESKFKIDKEVRKIVERTYERARSILQANNDILQAMKDALMKYETIDRWQIKNLMLREELQPPREYEGDAPITA